MFNPDLDTESLALKLIVLDCSRTATLLRHFSGLQIGRLSMETALVDSGDNYIACFLSCFNILIRLDNLLKRIFSIYH
jgi:hypothetical protein